MSTIKGKATTNTSTQASLLDVYQTVLNEQRVAFEAELAAEKAKFLAEQAEQLAQWKKDLARTKEEDTYNFNIAKRDREDALKLDLASRVQAVTERENKVTDREVSIGDAEKAIATLQATVDGIPFVSQKATEAGYTKGYADAVKELEANAKIKDAETKSVLGIKDNQIETLKARVVELESNQVDLRKDLATASQRVQEIANSAVNASAANKVTIQNAAQPTGR